MADTLRELAKQHPELLTVECEASHRHRFVLDEVNWWDCDGGRCPLCNNAGRRLKTLEELIVSMQPHHKSLMQVMVSWVREKDIWQTWIYPNLRTIGSTPTEAAARLLVALEADRD